MTPHALLLTDLVDSTLLGERLGHVRAAALWAEHDRCARDLLARHHGREIDRTDGFLLIFEDVADAARFALAYHRALAELDLSARAGLHVGPIILRENAPEDVARGARRIDADGLPIPVVARVMALARGRQTLLTAAARTALGGALPAGAEIESHGHYCLKGIEEPIEVFEVGMRASSPFTPPADVDKAYRVVRVGDFWRPVREVRHNLPAERDAFVGRSAELRALAARLDAGTRLLTVLGPGGTGKTRFVRRYGWTWLGDWPGGVYFCDLSEARSLDGIFFAVASALEVPLGKDDPAVQVGHAIAGRGRCLIIVDNFEQVVEFAPATLGRWLDRAPDAAFVVTSRERLHLPGEEIFPVEPLQLEQDAIELFAIRARAQRPDFVLGETNRAAVTEVVRLLDGLPLAIELAAARVGVLSPAQLVERMRDRFQLLAGARGAAARQATLRAAIDWSWELLTPWEQAAFAQCSTFDGGFTLEAAEAVLDLSRWRQAPPVIDVIQALTDKSLLRTWVPREQSRFDIDEPYFGMYITIHEYAAEKLEASGPTVHRDAEERHGRYFAGFGTDESIEALAREGGLHLRRAFALELDNLVTACRRAAQRSEAKLAVDAYRATWEVLEARGPSALGISLGIEVLAIGGLDKTERGSAQFVLAGAMRRAGRTDEAGDRYEEALELFRGVGNEAREANVRNQLGNLRRVQGRMDEAAAHLEASLATWRKVGNRPQEGIVLGNLGILHAVQGRLELARSLFERAIAIHREVGNLIHEGVDTNNLGVACKESGRFDEAKVHLDRALAIQCKAGNRREEAIVICNLAEVSCSLGGPSKEARELFETALALAREVGDRHYEGDFLGSLAALLRAQGSIDEALDRCEQALQIQRAAGNRRSEGALLGLRGELLAQQGNFGGARESLRTGEALLREVGDQLGLVVLLCDRGHVELAAADRDAALCALAAAEQVANMMGAGPDSEAGHRIVMLRAALA
jgi:predicted ATPase/class 3 adenylate cyclase